MGKEKEYGILVKTTNEVSIVELTEPLHVSLNELVGGYIEHVNPPMLVKPNCMIVDEAGLLKNKDINVFGSLLQNTIITLQSTLIPIAGDIVICKEGIRNGEMDIIGYTEEEVEDAYDVFLSFANRIADVWTEFNNANKNV